MLKWQDKSRAGTAEGQTNLWQVPGSLVVTQPFTKFREERPLFHPLSCPLGALYLLLAGFFFLEEL